MRPEFMRVAAQSRLTALTICFFTVSAGLLATNVPAASARTPAATISSIISSFTGRAERPAVQRRTPQRTSFVIGLKNRAEFQVFSLTSPNRVIVELSAARLAMPPAPGAGNTGLVKSFRVGRSAPGKSRIVINVKVPVIVELASIKKPTTRRGLHHLVLSMAPVESAPNSRPKRKAKPAWVSASAGGLSLLGARNVQPPLPKRAMSKAQRQAKIYKPVVVIDPGHGGRDTGAKKNGAVESHVVLAFAKALRKRLAATGRYRVLMTRDKDVFVPLDDRVRFANKHNAQLFIAVHADYAGSSARGATIYSLRDSTARRLRRRSGKVDPAEVLSSRERRDIKKKARGNVSIVQNILADLASNERLVNHERTSAFSETVIRSMGQTTNMKNQPHRGAGFRVIKTIKVPSVLIELAYVTNRKDAALLKSKKWRWKVAGSIATAVDNYFGARIAQLPM